MNLLSVDTCGAAGSVALARLEDGRLILSAQSELSGRTYSARLIPTIRELVSPAALASLAAIVVTSGPGSFTGIRIGLSTAKGLAEIHGIPLVAVSRLAVLAHKAGTPAAALDASRSEFYLRAPAPDSPPESLVTRDQFEARSAVLRGDLAICELSVQPVAPAAALVPAPTAADALVFALRRLQDREYDDPVTLDGNYLRRSDAEIFAKSRPESSRS